MQALLRGHTYLVWHIAFSPYGKLLATTSWDRTVRLWNVEDGHPLARLTSPTDWVRSVAFSPDGKALAAGSGDASIVLYEVATWKSARVLKGQAEAPKYLYYPNRLPTPEQVGCAAISP